MSTAPLTVSQLTAAISGALAARPELEDVLVEGEISNLSTPASGHIFFTLKDAQACLHCVSFRSNVLRIPFRPENGMTVITHGSVQVYAQQGHHQLYVDRMEPSGVGALALAAEQVRRRLAAQGLFDAASKRRLPLLPRRVVVVTSRSGAALRDVCTVVSRRAPGVDVVLSPATVQGEGAAETIALALRRADLVRDADVILLVRGGGSLEDLMAFNTEQVARAVRATRLPVVSGIGHETDTTVADLAADQRAATPSAAAEVAVPSVAQLHGDVVARRLRLAHAARAVLERRRQRVEGARRGLDRLSPARLVAGFRQDLERRRRLLDAGLRKEMAVQRRRLDRTAARLGGQQPLPRLAVARHRLDRSRSRLQDVLARRLQSDRGQLATASARLEALSPRRTLERGYSITLDEAGGVVTAATSLHSGESVRTLLSRGWLQSTVTETGEA